MNFDNDNDTSEYEPDEPRIKKETKRGATRRRSATIWAYFKNVDGNVARCLYCQNLLSHRSTVTNLKQHLSIKHSKEVRNDIKSAKKPHISLCGPNKKLSNYDSYTKEKRRSLQHAEPDGDSSPNTCELKDRTVHLSSEIWRHFEQDNDEAKCNLCKQTLPSKLDDMKNHLEDHHASLFDAIISNVQKSQDAASEAEFLEDDNNVYTEVLYLDESGSKLNYTPTKRNTRPSRSESTFKNEVKIKDSERPALKEEEPVEDELEIFLNYIRLLLKKVPKEANQQLHLDMINLIMKAQINHRTQHNIVVETVAANNGSNSNNVVSAFDNDIYFIRKGTRGSDVTNTTRVITVPLQNLLSENNSNKETVSNDIMS